MPWPLLEAAGAGSSSACPCWTALQEQGREADGFRRASASGSVDWRGLDLVLFDFIHLCSFLCLMTHFSNPLGTPGVLHAA